MQTTNDLELLKHINENSDQLLIEEGFKDRVYAIGAGLAGAGVTLTVVPNFLFSAATAKLDIISSIWNVTDLSFLKGISDKSLDNSILEKAIKFFRQFADVSGISDSPLGNGYLILLNKLRFGGVLNLETATVLSGVIVTLLILVSIRIAGEEFKKGSKSHAASMFRKLRKFVLDYKKR